MVRKMRNLSELTEKKKKVKVCCATSKAKDVVGWKSPPRDWERWARKLSSVHESTWKNAGIYKAVMSSIYPIKRQDNIILELASRWCSQTNTFIFLWGNATLTLEDMFILGGFSASGISAFSSLQQDVESLKIKEQLEIERMEILGSAHRARHGIWMKKFIGSEHELEHAVFLSVWLSRFVFPTGSTYNSSVDKNVFPIAARLSQGIKIALGPVVLATVYSHLTALSKIQSEENSVGKVNLLAPFHLVQIWAWERFPMLKPDLDSTFSCEEFPRIARWSKVNIPEKNNLKYAIDSCGKADFVWCPYGAFAKRAENDPESFALFVTTSELLGIGSHVERYQPQYVTRQFGLDQDLNPVKSCGGKVDKMTNCEKTNTCASFQPTITSMYEKWRKQKRCLTMSEVKVEDEVECGPPPGFAPLIQIPRVVDSHSDDCPKLKGREMEVVNVSVNETREDEGKVADALSFDAESYTNKRSMDSCSDLEIRISRLEDIVYALESLEASTD